MTSRDRQAPQCNHHRLTGLCNVALCVPEGPDDGVDHQLQLLWRQGVQRVKAVVGDRPQQVEELQSVLREVLQIGVQLSGRPWADMAWGTIMRPQSACCLLH